MADSTYKPGPIAADDFQRFLTARQVTPRCPMCQHQEWTNMEDAENPGFAWPSQSVLGAQGGKILPVSVLICTNCHFVWTIARIPVEQWVKEHPDAK